jgi:aspartyl-tRNA(Asn)/glutamyl-tRNA(Gln) amidotransferase subunit A
MNSPTTISELHSSLKHKEYSLVELLDNYFSRIKSFDKDLNAFLTVTDDYAYTRAKNLQKVLSDNPNVFSEFPLFGVPIALKDLYLTRGIRTTAASKVLEDYVPAYSSTVFERLEEAGAILVGKTNCDAWAHGASGENSDFGATSNPWNRDYVPGGSSSGSAVSVSANFSLSAVGTDTGGSIRQPASFTNTVGFKPTYGAVSRYGVVAMASSLDTMGHFTRVVEDSKKIFEVTRGADGKDGTLVPDANYKKPSGKIKIGIPKEYFADGLNSEVKKKVDDAIKILEKDYEVSEVSLPHTKYAVAVYYIVQPAEVSSNLGRYDGVRYGNKRSEFGEEAKRRIILGTYSLSSGYYDAYYGKAMKVRTLICRDFDNVFSKVDALLTPTSPTPPFKLGEKKNDPLEMYLSDVYTVSANLSGIPGLSLPAGFSKEGLPIGVQLLAPRFSENTLFEIGNNYQRQTDWHTKTPNL